MEITKNIYDKCENSVVTDGKNLNDFKLSIL
jgi:hypothetical protein